MMTLKEAIEHCKDVALSCTNKECALEHFQLLKWLQEYSNMLEKQDEQKPIDDVVKEPNFFDDFRKTDSEVESKFHEGEWITNGDYTWKIVEVKSLDYILQSQDGNIVDDTIFHVDEQFHSFTLQDAKDGDVLVNWNNTVFIFKTIEDETVKFHIAYNEKWDAIKTPSTKLSHLGLPEPQFEFHLATKEQRDLLFQKMKEAGYEWNEKEKRLIEVPKTKEETGVIKQLIDEENPAWSEEDERMYRGLHNLIYSTPYCDSRKELSNFLDSLKNRLPLKLQQEWSKEDEKCIRLSTDIIDSALRAGFCVQLDRDRCVDWLKSLRPQNSWKPSDEQMRVLDLAIRCGINRGTTEETTLVSLFNDLKKLKG